MAVFMKRYSNSYEGWCFDFYENDKANSFRRCRTHTCRHHLAAVSPLCLHEVGFELSANQGALAKGATVSGATSGIVDRSRTAQKRTGSNEGEQCGMGLYGTHFPGLVAGKYWIA